MTKKLDNVETYVCGLPSPGVILMLLRGKLIYVGINMTSLKAWGWNARPATDKYVWKDKNKICPFPWLWNLKNHQGIYNKLQVLNNFLTHLPSGWWLKKINHVDLEAASPNRKQIQKVGWIDFTLRKDPENIARNSLDDSFLGIRKPGRAKTRGPPERRQSRFTGRGWGEDLCLMLQDQKSVQEDYSTAVFVFLFLWQLM